VIEATGRFRHRGINSTATILRYSAKVAGRKDEMRAGRINRRGPIRLDRNR
jgi:hypothetical protein